jgi:transcriptional regulator with XRE-family HTH domain
VLALQYFRHKRGWSQTTLAGLVNSYQPTISNIEQGQLKPCDALLDALADVLGVSPSFTLLRPVVVHEQAVFADSDERVVA